MFIDVYCGSKCNVTYGALYLMISWPSCLIVLQVCISIPICVPMSGLGSSRHCVAVNHYDSRMKLICKRFYSDRYWNKELNAFVYTDAVSDWKLRITYEWAYGFFYCIFKACFIQVASITSTVTKSPCLSFFSTEKCNSFFQLFETLRKFDLQFKPLLP